MRLRETVAAAVLATVVVAPRMAGAFCGFYVAPGDQKLVNNATQVVLMRSGTRTVLSMQNNYQGPPSEFAMVIPVPVVLHEGDVKTLPMDVFEHVEQMGAPRLVEYWEQDPCAPLVFDEGAMRGGGVMMAPTTASAPKGADLGVKIEAQFKVGEYDVVILSAKDSTGLDTWLRQENYKIPAGAEPLLRPYVEGGMKFFVAKVDPTKVKFVDGKAALSPLRFFYDSDDFALPIRLGLANSPGTQDLIVNILAPDQRYEVANYKNVTIPTNLDVNEQMRAQFAEFYAALFDRTVAKNPGAVVTEYAWAATTCDPCPGPTLGPADFATLGSDVLRGAGGNDDYYGPNFVLTRLHARYGAEISQDLQFKKADPIVGGREFMSESGQLEEGAKSSSYNNFQGRYAIRHPWTGPITCDKPRRHVWGGPPGGEASKVMPATDLANAPRGKLQLASAVMRDVPEIGLKAAAPGATVPAEPAHPDFGGPGSATAPATVPAPVTPPAPEKPGVLPGGLPHTKAGGCGCSTSDGGTRNSIVIGALVLGALLLRRRRS